MKALVPFDIIAMVIKSAVFAFSIAIIRRDPLPSSLREAQTTQRLFSTGLTTHVPNWRAVMTHVHVSEARFLLCCLRSCGWGTTTNGGAKGVGESTTAAVVLSLVSIFILDFWLSMVFFHGTGDALRRVVRESLK